MSRAGRMAAVAVATPMLLIATALPADAYAATVRNDKTKCANSSIRLATKKNGNGKLTWLKEGRVRAVADVNSIFIPATNGRIGAWINWQSWGGVSYTIHSGQWHNIDRSETTRTFDVEVTKSWKCGGFNSTTIG